SATHSRPSDDARAVPRMDQRRRARRSDAGVDPHPQEDPRALAARSRREARAKSGDVDRVPRANVPRSTMLYRLLSLILVSALSARVLAFNRGTVVIETWSQLRGTNTKGCCDAWIGWPAFPSTASACGTV